MIADSRVHLRRHVWGMIVCVAWTLASLAWLIGSLAGMTIDRTGTDAAAAHNLSQLWPHWLASASTWVGLTGLWIVLVKRERMNAGHSGFFTAAAAVFLVAVAARAIVLAVHQPAVSDDVYRYIFEGHTFAAGFNPYAVKASERDNANVENFAGERDVLQLMTYHEVATPYLPISHLVFGTLGTIIGDRWTDPASSALVFRIAYTLIELVLIALLLAALRLFNQSAWWAALYAWHPLPITEVAGSGHQDVVGITVMVTGLCVFSVSARRTIAWAGLLGLASVVKPIGAMPGLFMLIAERNLKAAMIAIVTGGIVVLALVSLFWLVPSTGKIGFDNWRQTAHTLSEKWAHFGGVYESVLLANRKLDPADGKPAGYNLVQETRARRICMAVLAIVIIIVMAKCLRACRAATSPCEKASAVWRSTAAALLALVLLTTTAHPWYLLWGFALVPIVRSPAMWAFSLTLPWGYAVFATGKGHWAGEEWTVPPWIIAAAYTPVLATLIAGLIVWVVLQWRAKP